MADGWSTRPDNYDPQDPNTWSPEERVDYLTQAGFKWSKGNGNTALWTAPNGKPMNEVAAFTEIARGSVPAPPKAAVDRPDPRPVTEYEPDGRAFYWDTSSYGSPVKTYMPTSDRPDKAVGYRAPSTAAAPLPQTYTDRNGDLVGVDARSGAEVYRIPGATWATLSPAQQQQVKDADTLAARQFALQQASTQNNFTAQENAATRAATAANQQQQQGFTALQNDKQNQFTAGENAASRGLTAFEAATGRGFTASESANQRALAAAQFAAQQEAQQQGFDFQVQQANRAGEADASTRRLAAANQYANLVSSTDTAALPAYLAAGGGVLWNAKANTNAPSLLTDNAINPAASSLRDARTIAWQPIQPKAIQGFQQPTYQQWQEPAYVPPVAYAPGVAAQTPGAAAPPQPPQPAAPAAPAAPQMGANGPNTNAQGNLVAPGGQAGQWAPTPGFAGGSTGFVPAPQQGFYTSERGPEFMQLVDPRGANNAQIRVVPNGQGQGFQGLPAGQPPRAPGQYDYPAPYRTYGESSDPTPHFPSPYGEPLPWDYSRYLLAPNAQEMADVLPGLPVQYLPDPRGNENRTPGYADGTSADPTGMGIDPNGLDPYAAEVRQFRQNFQGPQYGFSQFDPRFSRRLSTGMQNAYFNGQQTQSGAPAEALANEAAYYRPRGYFSSPYHVTPDLAY